MIRIRQQYRGSLLGDVTTFILLTATYRSTTIQREGIFFISMATMVIQMLNDDKLYVPCLIFNIICMNVEFSRKVATCPMFESTDQVSRQQPLYTVPCSMMTV